MTSEHRKTVTVVFCDLAGSTALGEPSTRRRFARCSPRYFERMRAIVERHGGTVEKFIGDAVMAVFGVPAVHEDDALRAVRAAREMRDALPELGLAGRIGVITGEVVTGTDGAARDRRRRQRRRAARAGGAPGEILIGEPTLALVRDAVDVEPSSRSAEGQGASPSPRSGCCAVARRAGAAATDAPLVGRERELERSRERVGARARASALRAVHGRRRRRRRQVAARRGGCSGVDARRVVRGRCLPYGDGITYWPVVEVVKQLGVLPADEAAVAAIRSLLGESRRRDVRRRDRLGVSQDCSSRPPRSSRSSSSSTTSTGASRRSSTSSSTSRSSRRGAPILLLCLARPELPSAARRGRSTLDGSSRSAADDVDRADRRAASGRRAARRGSRAPPAATRCSSRRWSRSPTRTTATSSCRRRSRRCSRRGSTSSSAPERARARARRRRGRGLPPRRGPGARADGARVTPRLAALVRKELVRPDRAAARRRGRLPLPPPADPRRGLRRAAEGGARRPPRALRRLARGARRGARRARRDRRLPPRAGLSLPRRARPAERRPRNDRAATPDHRSRRVTARQDFRGSCRPARTRARTHDADDLDLAVAASTRPRADRGR